VGSIEDIKITAFITNTGSEAVRVLNYGTVLDANHPSQSFTIFKDGRETPFTGVKVYLSGLLPLTLTHRISF
jgi:deuterolysin